MNPLFDWLPVAASSNALRVDWLFLALTGLCGLIVLVLVILIVTFCVRYRRGSPASRRHVPLEARMVEVVWTVVPLLLFIGLCGWGAYDYLQQNRWPADAMPVFVVAKQWMWTLEHRNGRREINQLHVPLGQPVRLMMTSQDVIHSFFVPAFRLKQDVVPGRYTALAFTATRPGSYELFCAEYCGTEHAGMGGQVIVMPPAEFARWLAQGQGAAGGLAARGRQLFERHGCDGCHGAGSTVRAPPLAGLLGSLVNLQDGRRVLADDNYVRDSMLLPGRDVVAGYAPVMPSYAGQLSEEELRAIIEYLRGDQP